MKSELTKKPKFYEFDGLPSDIDDVANGEIEKNGIYILMQFSAHHNKYNITNVKGNHSDGNIRKIVQSFSCTAEQIISCLHVPNFFIVLLLLLLLLLLQCDVPHLSGLRLKPCLVWL